MPVRRNVVVRFFVLGTCSLLLVGIAAAAMPLVKGWWQPKDTDGSSLNPHDSSIRLVADRRNTFTVSPGVIQTLNVQTADVEKAFKTAMNEQRDKDVLRYCDMMKPTEKSSIQTLMGCTLSACRMKDADTAAYRAAAREAGMVPLAQDGMEKARQGLTTLEEVQRKLIAA